MIRFFCLNTFIALQTIVFCLWTIVLSVFDRKDRWSHFYSAAPWAKIILWVCGVSVEVKGLKNVDSHAPMVYLTNHQSYFDILALFACLPVNFKFVVKEELMRIPLFGLAMKLRGDVAVDRDDYRKAVKSMNEAAEKIANGVSMLIFPEGTRSEDGRLQPFKNGGFRLALKAGCDVVPMAIINSRNIVHKGSFRINKGTFGLHIGKPISVKDYSRKDIDKLMTRVREAMMSLMGGEN